MQTMLWVAAYITGMVAYWFLPGLILSRLPDILLNRKQHKLREMWPLTPASRVDHVLCDPDYKLWKDASQSLEYSVMLAPMTLLFWLLTPGPDTHLWLLWSVRALDPLLLGAAAIKVRLYVYRYLHRETLARQIHEERQVWDPLDANAKIFVSRRDVLPAAVELFDELVRHSYPHGLTLLQYTDFEWPTYIHRTMGPSQSVYPLPNSNAQSVARARALLWLDFGQTSDAMRSELEEAKRLGLPRVHVSLRDRPDVMTVGGVGAPAREVQRSAVAEAVVQELERVLAQPATNVSNESRAAPIMPLVTREPSRPY